MALSAQALRQASKAFGGILGQAWRGGPRQALLARALPNIDVLSLDDALGRRAGALLRRSGTADVVDAALVALASDGDVIFTSDPDDIAHLAGMRRVDVDIVQV